MTHTQHHVAYDQNGNIILMNDETTSVVHTDIAPKEEVESNKQHSWHGVWKVQEHRTEHKKVEVHTPETKKVPPQKTIREVHAESPISTVVSHTKKLSLEILKEGQTQYIDTLKNAREDIGEISGALKKIPKRAHQIFRWFQRSANQPIVMSHVKKERKKRSKAQLFIIDTIRFGGTFALIFGLLFSAINYQSFYQIAKAELALGDDLAQEKALTNIVRSEERTSSTSTADDLRSLLPAVGPMEDRLIIPKIGKNVPIVRPSMEALMKEDWPKFEDDIQEALRDGVVHYPGSAKPGQAGNFFLTGHSSYYPWVNSKYKDVFARLGELGIGDTYSVFYGGDKHTYRIIDKKEVKPSNVQVLDQPTNKRLATLMTCTPVGTTLRRLILVAEEVDPRTNVALTVGEKVTDQKTQNVKLQALPI